MPLDDNDVYRIQDIFRKELKCHLDDFKLYIEDQYQSKLASAERLTIFKEKHVDPLALKVYGFGAMISGMIIFFGLLLKIKGGN